MQKNVEVINLKFIRSRVRLLRTLPKLFAKKKPSKVKVKNKDFKILTLLKFRFSFPLAYFH